MYEIVRDAPEVRARSARKTTERQTMEALELGDGFIVVTMQAMLRARNTRASLYPKRFSVRKLGAGGWQVRREA